ncbi:MAG: molybdopterin-binding protein [Gammaproteobacteria bacterium]
MTTDAFGLVVIGDEILSGKRRDRHFEGFRDLLAQRGFGLAWFQILADDPALITERLRTGMREQRPVFCCGGIGATPDDHTRACAAAAAGVALERHADAVAEIEARFGAEAYPTRVRMADLPAGATLIPNPYNRIPGFSILEHHFLPGFPDMAHPMAAWVLDNLYGAAAEPERELALRVPGVTESALVDLMERLVRAYPGFKLFSLPRLGAPGFVELGFRGRGDLESAYTALCQALRAAGHAYEEVPPADRGHEGRST